MYTTAENLTGLLAERFIRVSAELRRCSGRRLAGLGLTHSQARLLRTLGDTAGAPRMSELAAGLGVVPRSATATVEALETAGYVLRVPDPADRRAVLVALTPAAERAVASIESARCEAADEVFGTLDVHERTALLTLLDRLDTSPRVTGR